MKKIYIVPLFLLLGGFISFGFNALSTSYIDTNGILHEPFFLVIFGYLFIVLAILAFCLISAYELIIKLKNK